MRGEWQGTLKLSGNTMNYGLLWREYEEGFENRDLINHLK